MSDSDRPAQPAPWTPPGAPAFGPPTSPVPPSAYARPAGHPHPAAPPPRLVPAPGSPGAPGGPYAAAVAPPGNPALGVIALIAALLAAVGSPIAVAAAGFAIGRQVSAELALRAATGGVDWSVLSPVRDQVLIGEIAFWAGTVLGIWAIVQGIIAIVVRRGRGAGIAAVVIAALGPLVFFVVLQAALAAGVAAAAGATG